MFKSYKLQSFVGIALIKRVLQTGLMVMATSMAMPAAHAASAAAISSGNNFNCAMTTAGGVMCWGGNDTKQLGSGTAGNLSQPIDIVGLASGVGAISTGFGHACALMTTGAVSCWGSNSLGQLGNGTSNNNNNKPTEVLGLTGVVAISAGGQATCAVTGAGVVKCWGSNAGGILGTPGAPNMVLFPADVFAVSGAVGVALGGGHACALLNTGGVQCWGSNSYGQLGNGATVGSTSRVNVVGVSDAVSISAGGAHTCIKTTSGAAKCWGSNAYGQIGNGGLATTNVLTPTLVTGLSSGVASVTTNGVANHSCAVLNTGEAKCWGQNTNRQLSTGDTVNRNTPATVTGLSGAAIAISIGQWHSCAMIGFNLQCWGSNVIGQLGVGTTLAYPFPVAVLNFTGSPPSLTPTPISPITSNTPVYTWKPIPGATNYRLNVNGTLVTFTAAAVGCDGAFGLCTVTSAPLLAGTYIWSVQGFNSFGDGPWSLGTSFKL